MPKAIWNGAVLAESDKTIVVEGNHYFPPESIDRQYFRPSETHTVCPWKGVASYLTWSWMARSIETRPGIIPKPSQRPTISRDILPFGRRSR